MPDQESKYMAEKMGKREKKETHRNPTSIKQE